MWRLPETACASHMLLILSLWCLSVASVDVRDPFNLLPAPQQMCLANESDVSIELTHDTTLGLLSDMITVGQATSLDVFALVWFVVDVGMIPLGIVATLWIFMTSPM